ncbi:MAG: hypothetical protein K9W44_16890 [Candidatus Lokiarchaeota archaeon]|nr:hypothetical protein [Candidatus Harpocratesius repetitus]
MGNYRIISTFEIFEQFWEKNKDLPIQKQISTFAEIFEHKNPELWHMQIDCYKEDGWDWKKIAETQVFPKFPHAVPKMRPIFEKLNNIIPWIFIKAVQKMQFSFDVNFVLYVGIGCGAGWATKFNKKRAVLMGLENIIDCGWHSNETLAGLIAHELGHLVHQEWRDQVNLPNKVQGDDAFWNLYEEGFAMRAEHKIMNSESFHEAEGKENWISWCYSHRNWLAKEYLRSLRNDEKIRRFFGSWFEVQGYKQTGYFLGHEILKEWEIQDKLSFKEIALLPLDEINNRVRQTLEQWIKNE